MPIFIIFIIYNVLQILVFNFFVLYLIYRMIKGKSIVGNLRQRLGFVPCPPKNKDVIWLHAVSVGEVLSVQHLVNDIKSNSSNTQCYLTVGTLAGKQVAEKNINADYISFMPYDFLPCMIIALFRIKPCKIH